MRFETDLERVREAPIHLKKLEEALDEVKKQLKHLEEARKELDASAPIPFEEYIRMEQHVHVVTQENKERYQKQYEGYLSMMQRREEAAMTRMGQVRERLREAINRASTIGSEQEMNMQNITRSLSKLVEVLRRAHRGLDYPPRQLTLEHLGNVEHEFDRHDWMKE